MMEIDGLVEILREKFPYGHKDFIPLMLDKMKLHSDKNYGYAAGGDSLGNFNREAILFALYPDIDMSRPVSVAAFNMLKQFDCMMWSLNRGHVADDEIEKRAEDCLVYSGIITLLIREEMKSAELDDTNVVEVQSRAGPMRMETEKIQQWMVGLELKGPWIYAPPDKPRSLWQRFMERIGR